jgi:hypothetical protein
MFPTLRRATLVTSFVSLLVTGSASASTALPATDAKARSPEATTTSPAAAHVALRDAIWRLERSLRTRLMAIDRRGSRMLRKDEPELSQLGEVIRVLHNAGRELGGIDGTALARKARALQPLLYEVERRESAGGAARSSASPWDLEAPATPLDSARGRTCADAIVVPDGRFAVVPERDADLARNATWLRYTSAKAGVVVVNTAGSDFDTMIKVYHACPAADTAPAARGDDEVGLQARASFHAAAGETVWIRVAGADGTAGLLALQIEGGSPGIQGVVTNEVTGNAPDFGYVRIWDANGFVDSAFIGGNGSYLIGLSPGTYFASTSIDWDEGLLDELYDGLPCAGGPPEGCSPTTGTPIPVQAGGVTDGIDFALGSGAAIAGQVQDAFTGQPLAGMHVTAYGSAGQWIGPADTDETGSFLVSGLASGVAFAVAGSWPYRRELYSGIPCETGCDVTAGTPIAVTVGQTTAGIDFALGRLGEISGTITRLADGSPMSFAQVAVWDEEGDQYSYATADVDGEYRIAGLDAGRYFVTTQTGAELVDEVYDDVPCDPSCDPTTGTPLTVSLGHTTAGVDFELRRTGIISGTLSDAVTGGPISVPDPFQPAVVAVFDGSGTLRASGYSVGGAYQVSGLLTGTYYVKASHPFYRSEIYDDLPCPGSCDPTTGKPVTVAIDGETAGIDFALTPLGSISGTVVDSVTNGPVDAAVRVWSSSSGQLVAAVGTVNGAYEVKGLPDGSYLVTAAGTDHAGEIYDDIPCPGGMLATCVLTGSTSVPVALGVTTSGIDFALVRKGRMTGTVRDASTSQGLAWARVLLYDNAGTSMGWTYTGSDGEYELPALGAGSYFLVADAEDGIHNREVYDDVPCPQAACSPTSGTPVPVMLGATTAGIDFALALSRSITGRVSGPDGGPLGGITVVVYAPGAVYGVSASTDAEGRYAIPTEPGTWYVAAYGGDQYASQLHSGIACAEWPCDLTNGTPVTVTTAADTPGIDFTLGELPLFANGFEPGDQAWTASTP